MGDSTAVRRAQNPVLRGDYCTSGRLVIRHANLIDGTGAAVRPCATVVVAGTRIESVSSGSCPALETITDARAIDGRGKYLIPGLWDSHVHAFITPDCVDTMMPTFVAHGIVGIRDMHGDIALAKRTRAEIDVGLRIGPRIVTAGLLIDGDPPIVPNTPVARTPREGREAVRARQEQGADLIKVYSRLARDVYRAILEEAGAVGLPVAGHLPFSVSAAEASAWGQRAFEHLAGLEMAVSTEEDRHRRQQAEGAPRVPLDAAKLRDTFSRSKADALYETLARHRTWQVPTTVARRALANHPLGEARGALKADARSACLPPTIRHMWTAMPAEGIAPSARSARQLMPLYDQLVGELYRAGVPIAAGSDTPNPFVFPGSGLHEELEWLVAAGLTTMDAIVAATANATRMLGLDATFGTIEPGKAADMLLLDGNPLEDIRNARALAGVVLNGKFLDRAALSGLRRQAEAAAQPPPPVVLIGTGGASTSRSDTLTSLLRREPRS